MFLEKYELLYKHQYGFMSKRSTVQIIYLPGQLADNNDNAAKDFTLTVFIDLSQTCDTISHDILIQNETLELGEQKRNVFEVTYQIELRI